MSGGFESVSLALPFDNSYGRLPDRFYTRMAPSPVASPAMLALNVPLARRLGIDADALTTPEGVSVLAGNEVPEGADPLAQVYAGHQFGGWSPQLGDGRAILLGEIVAPDGVRFDIQLKGSGRTPYSRMGDGRAWLGPVLREYIVSEAMAALGVPTTRALAAVTTGETIYREAPLPGAVLTRVAASHIRVGTFQYFCARNDRDALEALVSHAIERHAHEADGPIGLLNHVVERQARLVATWLGIGFIHGVMNTDNMTVSGETIDYGPCAFMDDFNPMRVFSSIDHQGRYAYSRQPDIAMWNLAQLATALLPLIEDVKDAQAAVDRFPGLFRDAWLTVFRAKLGLHAADEGDYELILALLDAMAKGQADFTNMFRSLGTPEARNAFSDPGLYDAWEKRWRKRLNKEGAVPQDRVETLHAANPALIPRNHRIEQAIQAAVAGDLRPFEHLSVALLAPFSDPEERTDLAKPPTESEVVRQTFCGT